MPKKQIFISCGQHTEEEKTLGREIKRVIDEQGMLGFFAEEVHQPADLNTFLFKELQRCDGFLAVLQKRGEVHYEKFPIKHRASAWIQQEIAILFYRSFLLGRSIPMRIYQERGILQEGITTKSIMNPIEFDNDGAVLEDLREWLRGPAFAEPPALARREDLFRRRIQNLPEEDWLLLELIAAHSSEPGAPADYIEVGKDFKSIYKDLKKTDREIEDKLHPARERLRERGLLNQWADNTGRTVFTIPRQWWELLLNEMKNQGRGL